MDLGECPQIHDLALRADYEAAQKKRDHFYDIDVSILHTQSKLYNYLIYLKNYFFLIQESNRYCFDGEYDSVLLHHSFE